MMASLIDITEFCRNCKHKTESYNEQWSCEACNECHWENDRPSNFEVESEEE